MKRARRFPQRLVRWTSLCVVFALVLTSFVLFPSQLSLGKNTRSGKASANSGAQGNGQERRVTPRPPRPGPPPGNVPNLDDMRNATDQWRRNGHSVHAPDPVPSTQRKWRHGQPSQRATSESKPNAVKANHARASMAEPQGTSDMAMARIDPSNRTGTGGVDLLSNNFNWSLGLAGLKGRGLDLGLSLAYNSLAVWTVSGNYAAFDMDQGDPSPGFRIGFPVVQGPYYNNLAAAYFYILITPSGQHVELRQISTYVYQAVDASYAQLTVNGSMVFRAGGAQFTFAANPSNTEYHCTEVKDRNGNYLTINYNGGDDIWTITDTLNRTINFIYDGNGNIQSITQTWNGSTHQWATFGWGTTPIGNNIFSSWMTYAGPTGGTSIPVINRVGLPDGSKYCFDYDGSYGVIKQIHYYAPDDQPNTVRHERRRTIYAINFTNTDSPRVTQERDWAEDWNGDTDGTPASNEEAVTQFGNTTAPPPTFNGYTYRRNVAIDHTKVPNTDQTNFPMLISGTYSYLKSAANGGNVQNANGYDIIFTSDSGCATKLSHEVETYNATTGAVNYWVKVPTVSHTSDTTIYMCYGNSSITTDQSNKTGVWNSNFVSVYHLPDGSTLNATDSTANANNGGNSGATATTGQIDGGGSFDGSSKAININHPSVFNFGNGDYTFEAWIKPTNNNVGGDFLSKDASGARQFCFQMGTNGGAGSLNFVHFNGDGTFYWRAGQNSSIATGSWSHVVAVRSGASLILYVNATSQTLSDPYSDGPLGTMAATATDALIGRRAYSGFENYFNGSIDEVRISNTARSADWLSTEYHNQSSPAAFYSISDASGESSGQVTQSIVIAPDGTVYKEYYGTGWQSGLVTETRNYDTVAHANNDSDANPTWKKKTTTAWTQENPNVSYLLNPRVIQTDIRDIEGNHRKTTISYQDANGFYLSYSLPYLVQEYAADGTTILRNTYTDYKMNPAQDQQYIDKRVIGLVSAVHVTDSSGWQGKVTYEYDEGQINSQATSATHHDPIFSTSSGRGNVTSVSRWDVTDINNGNKAHTSQMTYDAAGSVLTASDALSHQSSIAYSSSYAYAYPTTATDADGYSSSVQYNFDTGAVTQTHGPPPAGQSQGAIQNMYYDGAGRLQWITRPDGFWKYIAYADRGDAVMSQVSIADYPTSAWSITVVDGAGRTRLIGGDNPNSTGGYAGAFTLYDVMGRANQQSNVEETNAWWSPVGDDAAGWIYTQQTYDWKGRPLRTTNTDGTYKEASYGGCGCAGGAVVTVTDEIGRRQRVTSDSLGRQWKSEVLNWNGSVYATTESTFNARDQVTLVRQFQGLDTSGVYQDTTMSYDGYGRLQSQHAPEQNAGTVTSYTYNNDDTVNSVTDARGASATYGYNNRHLVSGITYSAPAGITVTAPVTFGYDAAGNRTSMTDGLGSASYAYDQLSQLTSETRQFDALVTHDWETGDIIFDGRFTLSYQYNLGGELKKITDATNMSINYAYDSTGRLSGVTGSDNLFMGVSNYAFNFQYRAWGGLKAVTDGSNRTSSWLYNTRLQPSHYEVSGNLVSQNYDYYNDGRVSFVHNLTDANFDRSYSYDHVTRVSGATSGGHARGDSGATPYHEGFGYDAFNNLNSRSTVSWGQDEMSDGGTYTNNRRSDWGYDANGNNTIIGSRTYQFDAAGQMTLMTGQQWLVTHYITVTQASAYDGEGRKLEETTSGHATYYLRSSVLNDAILEEINGSGQKNVGYVYSPAGELLAKQVTGQYGYLAWKYGSPADTSEYEARHNSSYVARTELDPLGANVPLEYTPPPEVQNAGDIGAGQVGGIMDSRWSNFFDLSGGCSAQGVAASCHDNASAMNNLGVMRPNLIQVTINITYKNGSKRTIQFVTSSSDIKAGFNHTFKGNAAVAAASAWNQGLRDGGLDVALLASVAAGLATEADPQNYRTPLSSQAVNQLKNDVSTLLKNGTCAKFVAGVLKALGVKMTAMDIFNAVENQPLNDSGSGGFGRRLQFTYSAQSSGSVEGGNPQVDVNYKIDPSVSNNPIFIRDTGLTVIHELFHVAGSGFDHYQMLMAGYGVAAEMGLVMGAKPPSSNPRRGTDPDLPDGIAFDDYLFQACK